MTVNATWTSPAASGALDLDTGEVITETWVDAVASNFNFIGGVSGVYGCRVQHNANQSINTATLTALAFNTESFDTDTMHDNSTNNSRITFTTAGKYLVGGHLQFAANATGVRTSRLLVGGATEICRTQQDIDSADTHNQVLVTYNNFSAADYAELQAYQTSGAGLNVENAGSYSPVFFAFKMG